MEAVVDMTPRLRIPSSSRRKQRSLSPSLPLRLFSFPPEMCHSPIFPLSTTAVCTLFTSFLFHPFPQRTQEAHTPKWPLTSLESLPTRPLKNWRHFFFLTLLLLHRASQWCRRRRSTPLQRDGAPLLMPSGHDVRHKLAQHLWIPAGQTSSQGPTQTLGLRRRREHKE